jgi:hypothetical protein
MPIEVTSGPRKHILNARAELIVNILKPENWPTPKWYGRANTTTHIYTYEDYLTFQLQELYLEREHDLRSVLGYYECGTDPCGADVIAGRVNDLLHSAREALEHTAPNLLLVSSTLDLAERYMLWLYPPHVGKARITAILFRLGTLSPFQGKDSLVGRLTDLSKEGTTTDPGPLRALSEEAILAIHIQITHTNIGRGLQINRLRSLRLWGVVVLLMLLLGSPLATNITNVSGWPSEVLFGASKLLTAWMNALVMLLLGGVGGFLSGLLHARSTRVTQSEYLENMLKLQLRPIVGAMVALMLYSLLSWQVLPGITIQSAGSYFIMAFLAGFSERYFLRLLDIKSENGSGEASEQVETTTSGNPTSLQATLRNESDGEGAKGGSVASLSSSENLRR